MINETIDTANEKIKEINEGDQTNTFDPKNVELIRDLVNQMESEYGDALKLAGSSVTGDYSVDPIILEVIVSKSKDDIANMSDYEIREYLNKYTVKDKVFTEDDDVRSAIEDIKNTSIVVTGLYSQVKKVRKDAADILKEYSEYASSKLSDETIDKRIASLKESLKADTSGDEHTKLKMAKKIEILEQSKTLEFFLNRIKTLGTKETDSIVESFFDNRRSAQIVEKYRKVISKYGFNDQLYKYFFNIEEKFLDEKYHPFNNLFLFAYMRYVSHTDQYSDSDNVYVVALTSSIAKLNYHNFASDEDEKAFIEFISNYLDNFEEFRDIFVNDNVLHPNHPERLAADNRYEVQRKDVLIKKMLEMEFIDDKTAKEYYNTKTADELQKELEDKVDKMIDEETKKTNNEEVTEDPTTEVSSEDNEPEVDGDTSDLHVVATESDVKFVNDIPDEAGNGNITTAVFNENVFNKSKN